MPIRPRALVLVALVACRPGDTDPPDTGPDPVLEQMAADPAWCPDGAVSVWLDTYNRVRCEWEVAAGCTDQTVETCIDHDWHDASRQICGDGCDARECLDFYLGNPGCAEEAPTACWSMFQWQGGECHPDADTPRGTLAVEPSPCVLAYGDVAPGESGLLGYSIFNKGAAALYISEISSSDDAFRIVSHGPLTLGSGSQYRAGVPFTPTTIGPRTATLSIVTDVGTATCALSGRAWRDADGDTYADATVGGDDCADDDATRHPGAADPAGDGVDSDCDGADG